MVCVGDFLDMRRSGVSIAADDDVANRFSCNLNWVSERDFQRVVEVCGEPRTINFETSELNGPQVTCRVEALLGRKRDEKNAFRVVRKVLRVERIK
jgi:hypothetical protein